ncbi:HAD-like domain protein [Moelleriella libera RCEF 2490]|uniref:HAD-like domain protein n=1 Tax=Moelleriella libera RCEF 2490 TaxID=1081109 RepID=A0A167ZN71_9HYPO|nr:HAD-like domain protein [Moelleriella libera RCEF 2490]
MAAPSQETPSIESGRNPSVFIFDLLTTLADTSEVFRLSTASGKQSDGKAWQDRIVHETSQAGAYVPYETLIKRTAASIGIATSGPLPFDGGWTGVQEVPGARKLLQRLNDGRGEHRLGAFSNSSSRVGDGVAAKVAPGMLDAVITAEGCGFYEPRAEAYQACLKAMKVDATAAVFVVSNAEDFMSAKNSGMAAILYRDLEEQFVSVMARL